MGRLSAAIVAILLAACNAYAATPLQHLRGTLTSVSGHSITLTAADGTAQTVLLVRQTSYALLARSTLAAILPESYISTAAKGSGPNMIALEIDIFPPALRDEGEGHYPWDTLPDISNPGSTTASTLTNGSVQTVSTLPGGKQISIVYPGGKQIILALPATPVVATSQATAADLKPGAHVLVFMKIGAGKTIAVRIIAGADGLIPPM